MSITLDKIYTKFGDKGETSLADGEVVSKKELRIEVYGTCDELQAFLGRIKSQLADLFLVKNKSAKKLARLLPDIYQIQNNLFNIGSLISCKESQKRQEKYYISKEQINSLEKKMDMYKTPLSTLDSFVLSGSSVLNADCHIARTICRRLERMMWQLKDQDDSLENSSLIYINRLSDYLFVLSRYVSYVNDEEEVLWKKT